MKKERAIEILDMILLVSVAVIASLILLLGLLDWVAIINLSFQINYAYVSSALLSVIAFHLALSVFGNFGNKEINNKIDNSTRVIIDSLVGIEKQIFNSMNEVDSYITKRIKEANTSVYDLNWLVSEKPSNKDSEKDRIEKFHENLNKGIKSFDNNKSTLFYREIFVFHYPLKVTIMKKRLNFNKYSCKFYERDNKFPKIQFVIIDDKEVIFISSLYKNGQLCSVKDDVIVKLFIQYFDYSWKTAKTIKEDGIINHENLKEIENKDIAQLD